MPPSYIGSVRYQHSSKTFGDYMLEKPGIKTNADLESKPLPSGYKYFAAKFPIELKDLKKYLTKKYPDPDASTFAGGVDLKTFNIVETYKAKKAKAASKPRLFITLLNRNPIYMEYIIWDTFDIDTGEKRTATQLRSRSGSFKDLLQSINKVKPTNETLEQVLPKMTKFKAEPTTPPFFRDKLDLDLKTNNLEDFLSHAKKESDLKRDNMFKARMNYEWSKQQLNKHSQTVESKTFFTPILVPGTLIPSSWIKMADYSEVGGKQYEFLFLEKNGNIQTFSTIPLKHQYNHNVFEILRNLRDSHLYIDNIDRLFAKDWRLLDGDRNRLAFARNRRQHYWNRIKYALLPICAFSTALTAYVLYITS
ncbi:hypothetical protein FOA43_001242 [Brettanomyces nanus]|uniref:Uncharacterized protein n=1 Tax=Eeniella nana TaxID=13502 RepID=A0A875RTW7_EENNA|nr:uncharacterized protein FOA43_001242 [Brettanomyces nanus]QPG73927.1 hypothetical protein FOA43_001242 [Brettanomyces nanus]